MANGSRLRPHLRLETPATSIDYHARSAQRQPVAARANRQAHAAALRTQLRTLEQWMPEAIRAQREVGLEVENGITIEILGDPHFDLPLERLDLPSQRIRLLSAVERDGVTHAMVFVPDGQLVQLINRLEEYAASINSAGNPRHSSLLDSIAQIRAGALTGLWTEPPGDLPQPAVLTWWEVWFRNSDLIDFVEYARTHAGQLGIEVGDETGKVLDRTIVLVRATREQLERATLLLSGVAEIRKPQVSTEFFLSIPVDEQADWIAELSGRLVAPPEGSARICILDTGVNYAHPLLGPVVDPNDAISYNGIWPATDGHGHGTQMAGLVGLGDLAPLFDDNSPVPLHCRVESCKILEPPHQHDPKLYGSVTRSAVAITELTLGEHPRSFVCAVTALSSDGSPSEWSSTIDALASGSEDGKTRLFILSAGNSDPGFWQNYIDSNLTDTIQNPSQSLNALTVGAHTEKWQVDLTRFPECEPIADLGDLSPESTTSFSWRERFKPDVVMEGGNIAIDPITRFCETDSALQLLTTGKDVATEPLVAMGGTSASAALCAGLAGRVQTQYPGLKPATIRALIVHAAELTEVMKARFPTMSPSQRADAIRGVFGYGVPNVTDLLWSLDNSPTLIIESAMQPFAPVGSSGAKFNEFHLYDLPWPSDLLESMGEVEIGLKVTLSYFVEPSPGRRGNAARYKYASHGLRFKLRRPAESLEQFSARVNAGLNSDLPTTAALNSQWDLGPTARNRGCIHSDTWRGSAAELARRDRVAIVPVAGWWKYRKSPDRRAASAPYTLVMSIKAPAVGIDLYTPISNMISVPIDISVGG